MTSTQQFFTNLPLFLFVLHIDPNYTCNRMQNPRMKINSVSLTIQVHDVTVVRRVTGLQLECLGPHIRVPCRGSSV
jgi:hypothetical protein